MRPSDDRPGLLRSLGVPPRLLRRVLMDEGTVLFVCVENVGRSLMAEAIFNADPPPGWRATSGGTRPGEAASPRTALLLQELGLALPDHPPQGATAEMIERSDVRVTLGCPDDARCPANLKTLRRIDWALPDPARLDENGARDVRERIREKIRDLRAELMRRDRRPPGPS